MITIAATTAGLARAFQADTDTRALIDRPPYWPGETATADPLPLPLAFLYSPMEATELLTPQIAFRDGLPGASVFVPARLRTLPLPPEPARTAHEEAGANLAVGVTVANQTKLVNLGWLRQGLLLAGPPGTGKTSAASRILRSARRLRPGLAVNIIDPVGFEYLPLAEEIEAKIIRFEAGREPALRFNPFYAPRGVSLSDHSSTIAKLLTAVFPGNRTAQAYLASMVAAVLAVKWELRRGQKMDPVRTTGEDQRRFPETVPTFAEFLSFGPDWLERQADGRPSAHHAENVEYFRIRGNLIRSSLSADVMSGDQPLYEQLSGSFLLSLQSIVNVEVKQALLALVLGLHLSDLQSDPRSTAAPYLERLVLLEEAHEVIGKGNLRSQSDELAASSSELLAQQLSGMLLTRRKFGVGFVVLDQSVSNLIEAVAQACGNVVAFRTLFREDQDQMARLLGLSPSETRDLGYLRTGECIARFAGDTLPTRVQLYAQ